jgi:hypothetical protein
MQAYATPERSSLGGQLRTLDRSTAVSAGRSATGGDSTLDLIDEVLGRLADLVVDRLIQRNAAPANDVAGEWPDARGAAEYLGMHRDTLRKLAAQRAVPSPTDLDQRRA